MRDKPNQVLINFHLTSDEELFILIQKGVKAAYQEIVERWAAKLYKKAYKGIQDISLALALVKQVFAELWENRDRLRVKKVSDYLIGSLKSKLYIFYKQKRLPNTFNEPLNHFAMAILKADAALSIEQIKSIIKEWIITQPNERVQIFNLKYKARLTSREISERLDISLKIINEELRISRSSLNKYVRRFLAMNLD